MGLDGGVGFLAGDFDSIGYVWPFFFFSNKKCVRFEGPAFFSVCVVVR